MPATSTACKFNHCSQVNKAAAKKHKPGSKSPGFHSIQPMDVELPAFIGFLGSTLDALIAVEAVRRGMAPRLTRRLSEEARTQIASGHIYVFNTEESGIKRWTDGRQWSPSRILDNFLIYRELKANPTESNAEKADTEDSDSASDLRDTGLVKKTITLCEYHVVSYYTPAEVINNSLHTPSSTPQYASLRISSDLLLSSSLRYTPILGYDSEGVVYKSESLEIKGNSLRLHRKRPRAKENLLPARSESESSSSAIFPPRHSTISPPPQLAGNAQFQDTWVPAIPESRPIGGIAMPFPELPRYDYASSSTSLNAPAINYPPRTSPPPRHGRQNERHRHSPYPSGSRPTSTGHSSRSSDCGDSDSFANDSSQSLRSSRWNSGDSGYHLPYPSHMTQPIPTGPILDTAPSSFFGEPYNHSQAPAFSFNTDQSLSRPGSAFGNSTWAEQQIIHSALNPMAAPYQPPAGPSFSFPHEAHYGVRTASPEPYASIPPHGSIPRPSSSLQEWDRPPPPDVAQTYGGFVAAALPEEGESDPTPRIDDGQFDDWHLQQSRR